eukprot:5221888-Amphidinium_carterae.1
MERVPILVFCRMTLPLVVPCAPAAVAHCIPLGVFVFPFAFALALLVSVPFAVPFALPAILFVVAFLPATPAGAFLPFAPFA